MAKRSAGSGCHLVPRYASAQATLCYMGTQLPPSKRAQQPHFTGHVYCGQTVIHLSNCWAVVYKRSHNNFKWRKAVCSLYRWRTHVETCVSFAVKKPDSGGTVAIINNNFWHRKHRGSHKTFRDWLMLSSKPIGELFSFSFEVLTGGFRQHENRLMSVLYWKWLPSRNADTQREL